MPNWAEGSLKIRGTRADIKALLLGALEPVQNSAGWLSHMLGGPEPEPTKAEITEDEWNLTMEAPEGFYIKDCRRAFVGNINWYFDDMHTEILSIGDFRIAWGVDAERFAELSKHYNVDIKIYVFEQGMEFNQDIEIHKGQIIRNQEIQFKDYEWECIFPNLGG